jgi:hypothetical protein
VYPEWPNFFPLSPSSFLKKLYYCFTRGYAVTFTKVLIIYHNWIHSLYHSPLSSLSPFLE